MDTQDRQMPENHQVVMNRFVEACQADERVVAAFLGGSYARGAADAYSDLDFGLITTDEAYEDFSSRAVSAFTGDFLSDGARRDALVCARDRSVLPGTGSSPGAGARDNVPG